MFKRKKKKKQNVLHNIIYDGTLVLFMLLRKLHCRMRKLTLTFGPVSKKKKLGTFGSTHVNLSTIQEGNSLVALA